MKKFKFILMMLVSLAFSFGGGAVGQTLGLDPVATGTVIFGSSLIPTGGIRAGINVEIWHNFIVENLFKDNEFLKRSVDVSSFVLNGSVVHIPNAGAPSNVERNRQNLPAQIKRRSDTDITYALDEFTSDPVAILRADKVELSYDKMNSVIGSDIAYINEVMANWMIYNWAKNVATASVLLTTGSAIAAHTTGATGDRKAFVIADLKKAQKKMNKDNIPKMGRVALFDSDMFDQFTDSLTVTQERDFSKYFDAKEGVLGRLYGFDIMERSDVLTLSTSKVVKEPGAAGATTDKAGVLLWQENTVELGKGIVEMFEDLKNPTMYGDIYSFLVRTGGRARRGDLKGVYIIAQDASA